MPVLFDQVRSGREIPGGVGLEEFGAPYLDQLGAVMSDAWARSPLSTIWRAAERARHQPVSDLYADDPFVSDLAAPPGEYSALLSIEELEERYAHLEMRWNRPTRRDVADMLASTRSEERARQRILARGGDVGMLGQAGYFAAGLLATMADPINVASAFVPIAGQARWAALAARIGRTPARAVRGGVEGLVGAALVEPIVYAGAVAESADYGAVDSLMNLAYGSILGGGLHVAGGKVADVVRGPAGRSLQARLAAARPATREAALRAAVAQGVQGRRIDVEPIIDADAAAAPRPGQAPVTGAAAEVDPATQAAQQETALAQARQENVQAAAADGFADVPTPRLDVRVPDDWTPDQALLQLARDVIRGDLPPAAKPVSLSQWVRRRGGVARDDPLAGDLRASGHDRALVRRAGIALDDLRSGAEQEGYRAAGGTLEDFIAALQDDAAAPGLILSDQVDTSRADALAEAAEWLERSGIDIGGLDARELAWLLSRPEPEAAQPGVAGDGRGAPIAPEQYAERQVLAEADELADADASAEMDDWLGMQADVAAESSSQGAAREVLAADAEADAHLALLDLTDEERASLSTLDELVDASDDFAAGVEALALCRIG